MDLAILLGRPVGLDEDVGAVVRDELVARVDVGGAFSPAGAGEGPVGSEVEDFACWEEGSGQFRAYC